MCQIHHSKLPVSSEGYRDIPLTCRLQFFLVGSSRGTVNEERIYENPENVVARSGIGCIPCRRLKLRISTYDLLFRMSLPISA